MIRVAINGFGRIGRNFARCLVGRKNSQIQLVGINDTSDPRTNAHLLRYDSMLGKLEGVDISADDNSITINGNKVKCVSDRNPDNLPWKDWGIDLIIESTGVFTSKEGAMRHVKAGAKKVLITAPGKNEDGTFVVGVNHQDYDHNVHNIISNASCTTNCLAPIAKVLDEKFGIIKGIMTTTHSYTGDQRLLDASHRDLRRARAAAINIVPTSTGAAKAVALVLPQLKGKLNGVALRVPTPNVSMVDFVVQTEKRTIAEEVNQALKEAAEGSLKGILGYTELELVSSDYQGTNESSIVDASLTIVMGNDMVKVMAWYDNEWGYSQRVLDLAELVAEKWV
ncbi:type I glyceraldehyde-3-phosphate dehydrogenase [Aphanizomenon flos-aquae NRERC-008]|uniref:Glyceraldehyde-3-phosphate dehydrogenase n=1 Tax=Aphanizomenon flos-aquae FACHB-1249 TaxID=2692889 RepID=A0ABR8IV49_APHFL|nr:MULTISPECIES: type I glyceraldehyde-3-phosphate dehydrogenase [Aphanizomenon]MBD2392092.1 type I glyceraldehyde-3-phosphate dehydrogenase [Aphanizomenon flos-aquae FACHB-1171]MBD2557854.1 type I glyceraldehyde-3-phosphate dehydrogenase [Aphanizomenon flos-aquae FACHB-1290]MBD2632292.1 type I glyceraldehyde-3-phosphate dehydrogenase [Aphanizomenon sp. FACHB-1399]MBD2658734.1 type I glyceraldehyde-3-phosphate dehydrogenase [Aphanizomenon flos-aquae FACHB-1265]MBD2674665.1 type I glyceraldehyd